MHTPPSVVLELVDVLHQEIAHLQHLAEVATEERAALQRLAMPSFETVQQRRVQTLDLLQTLESRRESILSELAREWGVVDRPLTVSAVMARVGVELGRTLEGQQHEMHRLVDAVRQLMAVNRLAMTKLVDFIQHTLTASQAATGGESTYSESGGKRTIRTSGRVLAQRG